MKRYDQWDQNSPITEVEFGRFALYGEAQDEFETMAKLCATKIEQQQAEIDRLTHRLFQMNKALEKERAVGYREGVMAERRAKLASALVIDKGE